MDRLKTIEADLVRLSRWIDEPSVEQDKLTQLLLRIGKLTEESGEVWDALIGVIGQNPRKGVYATWEQVDKELLDVIATAWGALEHRHGNRGVVADMLVPFVAGLLRRAGLPLVGGGPPVKEGDRVRVLEWDNRDSGFRNHATPVPVLGHVSYVGGMKFSGQPSIDTGGEENYGGFAAGWELVD